jgi:transposase InsO family protein
MSDKHSIKDMCAALSVSRSGYYQWKNAGQSLRSQQTDRLKSLIENEYEKSRQTYGSPRITRALRNGGEAVGYNRVARLMRSAGLQGRQKRRYRVRTTDSRHDQPIAPNHLAVAPTPTKPDQIWATDITYIETGEGWLYLAGVLDLYSRRLIGWSMGPSMETSLPLAALNMAVRQRRPAGQVLHHSDRGCQYASATYRQALAANGCIASMSRKGNCYDNAMMESFWSTLKHELVYRRKFATRAEATTAIFDYIEGFYNRTRLHSALGFKSPLDYESSLN